MQLRPQFDGNILLGGRGLSVKPHLSIHNNLSRGEQLITFDQVIKKRKLADHFILGDGEDAIIDLLSNNTIDSDEYYGSSKNLDYPFSNFDDVDFSQYIGIGGKVQLPVISSKGCVRACDFCDVSTFMKHFQSKQGSKLAEEMIYLAKRHQIYNFSMADSIVNGNMKSLKECCEHLAEYNKNNTNKIRWAANWICRYENTTKPEFFDLMAASGCESLTVGVESASNHVLVAMNKKSSIEGVHYEFSQLDRVGIQVIINNVIGHWSEHYTHFLEHVNFLISIGPLVANRTINELTLGEGFNVLMDTPVANNDNIIVDRDNFTDLWYAKDNPALTIKIKLMRVLAIYTLCSLMNYPVYRAYTRLEILYNKIIANKQRWSNWSKKHLDIDNFEVCPTVKFVQNLETYLDQQLQHMFATSRVKLVVHASQCNGWPNLIIEHNGSKIVEKHLDIERCEIEFEIKHNFSQTNILSFRVDNKNESDTVVNCNGNITQDKRVVFQQILVDGIDLFNDPEFFYNQTEICLEDGSSVDPSDGLYLRNSRWQMKYKPPFWRHYLLTQPSFSEYIINNNQDSWHKMLDITQTELETMEY
jgi:hypothetical protein